jgi:hypothetical protein
MKPRIVYFDFPVRAEVGRLLFTMAKVDFDVSARQEQTHLAPKAAALIAQHSSSQQSSPTVPLLQDTRISYDEGWAQSEWKEKATFGQVPLLETSDGKVLVQSAAIGELAACGLKTELSGHMQP